MMLPTFSCVYALNTVFGVVGKGEIGGGEIKKRSAFMPVIGRHTHSLCTNSRGPDS